MEPADNVHPSTVQGFGQEWSAFDQLGLDPEEHRTLFGQYFDVFPWAALPATAVGADLGCGSGRWARLVAPRVGHLACVDASPQALAVARRALAGSANCSFVEASVAELPFGEQELDFAYSLGVLHHVPDPEAALRSCARVLAPGAPFLVYLYYALDARPAWFRGLWRLSDAVRRVVCRLGHRGKLAVSSVLAAGVYWPLARVAVLVERLGAEPDALPLSYYRRRSFYTMRTDAYDRFGTRLEHRFTRDEVAGMLARAGFVDVTFSEAPPYWHAVAYRGAASASA